MPRKKPISNWAEIVHRQIEILMGFSGSMALAWGLYAGIVSISGGHIIPWVTPDALIRSNDDLRDGIRKEFNTGFEVIRREADDEHCKDYNGRLDRAAQALSLMPNDMYQRLIYSSSIEELNKIPNCKVIFPLMPVPPR